MIKKGILGCTTCMNYSTSDSCGRLRLVVSEVGPRGWRERNAVPSNIRHLEYIFPILLQAQNRIPNVSQEPDSKCTILRSFCNFVRNCIGWLRYQKAFHLGAPYPTLIPPGLVENNHLGRNSPSDRPSRLHQMLRLHLNCQLIARDG